MAAKKNESMESSESKASERPVLVTTAHRGVFFGYLVGEPSKEKVLIDRPRNVVFWDAACHGFLGLAAKGPTKACRIGPSGAQSTVFDITGVFGCTAAAAARFEEGSWG